MHHASWTGNENRIALGIHHLVADAWKPLNASCQDWERLAGPALRGTRVCPAGGDQPHSPSPCGGVAPGGGVVRVSQAVRRSGVLYPALHIRTGAEESGAAQGAVADIQEHHATHGDGAALHSDGCRVQRAGSVSRALIHAEAGALGADHCGGRLEPNARRLSRLAARPPARRSPAITQRIGMRRQSSSRVPQIVFGVAAWRGRRLRGIPRRGQGLQPRLQLLNRLPICADQTHGQDRA